MAAGTRQTTAAFCRHRNSAAAFEASRNSELWYGYIYSREGIHLHLDSLWKDISLEKESFRISRLLCD
jgi:hypothetical protein